MTDNFVPTQFETSVDILPDSRCQTARGVVRVVHGNALPRNWVPCFCASCHVGGPFVPQDSTHAFWLCNKCAPAWGAVAGTYAVSDDVFFGKLQAEQQEVYGRQLTAVELVDALQDGNSSLAKLVRSERPTT